MNFCQKIICQVTPSLASISLIPEEAFGRKNHLSATGTDEFDVSFWTTKIWGYTVLVLFIPG